jgi:hypothetical protein
VGLNWLRWETIRLLRRAEYGYAENRLKKLLRFMPEDFRNNVVHSFNECDHARVADLLEHRWPKDVE